MSISEHYSLKLFGTITGQQFLNTFTYRQLTGTETLSATRLRVVFESNILFPLSNLTGTYCDYDRIETFAIETPLDYDDTAPAITQGGRSFAVSGIPPTYVAFGYRSSRAGAGSRSSYKRFCGIGDTDMEENDLAPSFIVLEAAAGLQTALQSVLVSPGGNTYIPVQLESGWLIGVPPVENFAIASYGPPYLTSQVSRRQ